MTAVEIPFQPQPQRMTVTLAGTSYILQTCWNAASSCWNVDFHDASGNLLVGKIPLVTGVNLLEQVAYLGIGGPGAVLFVYSDQNIAAVPQFANLGVSGHVILLTP